MAEAPHEAPREAPEPPPDERIVRARQGDQEAMGALLEEHLPALRAYLRIRGGHAVRAEESAGDLAQSICREVLEGITKLHTNHAAGFRSWLYTMALHKVLDRKKFYEAEKRHHRRDV